MKKRITYIDFAKAIAIYLVVIAHFLRNGAFFAYLIPASVPVFFALSGLTYSYDKTCIEFFGKKIKTIVIPYFFAAFVSVIVYTFLGKNAGTSLKSNGQDYSISENIFGIFYANAKTGLMKWNNSLWFLPCLFSTLSIVFLFDKIVSQKKGTVSTKIRIIFAICSSLLGFFITAFFPKFYLPWHIETALINVAFVECGIILKDFVFENFKASFKFFIIMLIAFLAALVLSYLNGEVSARTDEYSNFLIYFVSALLFSTSFMLLGCFFDKAKIMHYVGRSTLQILIWNKFPIILMQMKIPFIKNAIKNPDEFRSLVICFLPSMAVIFICIIIGKIQNKLLPVTLPSR